MANETDFLELYRTLGLSPGCDLHEFKRAYRRHVSQLHPDRVGGDARLLQTLIAQYGAAMDFQRRHGRLPGAAAPGRIAPVVSSAAPPPRSVPVEEAADEPVPPRARPTMLILLVVVVLGVLLWSIAPLSSPESTPATSPADTDTHPHETASVPSLSLGMTPDEVRAIEGDPLIVHRDRWDYGPSWIQFENDQVIDWYSSPLHSLRTASSRPSEAGH